MSMSPDSARLLLELLEERSVPVTHPAAVATVTTAVQARGELQAIIADAEQADEQQEPE